MTRDEILSRISIDPSVCFGKPCIKGHRIWVSLILDFLASGWTFSDILENDPSLKEEDIPRLPCLWDGDVTRAACRDLKDKDKPIN